MANQRLTYVPPYPIHLFFFLFFFFSLSLSYLSISFCTTNPHHPSHFLLSPLYFSFQTSLELTTWRHSLFFFFLSHLPIAHGLMWSEILNNVRKHGESWGSLRGAIYWWKTEENASWRIRSTESIMRSTKSCDFWILMFFLFGSRRIQKVFFRLLDAYFVFSDIFRLVTHS